MTAVPPRPAAPDCDEKCDPADSAHAHLAAPDATAGDGLREALRRALLDSCGSGKYPDTHRQADAVLALPALRDVLAAAARDAEKVRRVRKLADEIDDVNNLHIWSPDIADRIRRALDGTS